MKKDSLINSKRYNTAQMSILKRFFTTVSKYGGDELSQLADILIDEYGDTTRCVILFCYFIIFIICSNPLFSDAFL